jgi:hypothetical protein
VPPKKVATTELNALLFGLTGYGRILYIYSVKIRYASLSSIKNAREEVVPAFLSSGRWIKEGNSELGIRVYR